ncbi:MAG: hypothetical protein KBT04_07985 [Bacteroidales bacterium]|nr:hypothetical protein [Candidatus Colimorpha onthohippi]
MSQKEGDVFTIAIYRVYRHLSRLSPSIAFIASIAIYRHLSPSIVSIAIYSFYRYLSKEVNNIK